MSRKILALFTSLLAALLLAAGLTPAHAKSAPADLGAPVAQTHAHNTTNTPARCTTPCPTDSCPSRPTCGWSTANC